MIGLENIYISLAGSFWVYILLGILLVVFSFFIYRFTTPRVPGRIKISLTIVRSLIFVLILFLIFEPLLSISSRTFTRKSTLVFIDNSKSISEKDSSKRSLSISNLINLLNSKTELNAKFYSFGARIDSIIPNNFQFAFNEQSTNFSNFLDFFNENESIIKSAIIVSDGIITEGSDPSYQFERLQFPLFTVGVGDSTTKRDIEIFNVTHNQFIYAGTQTKIQAVVKQNGFDGELVRAGLFEEDRLIDSKDIQLYSSGVNQIDFTYTPKDGGERKLKISISPKPGEYSQVNNSKTFFITVIDTKLKLALIAGTPSPDVSAIANILESDKNLRVNKFVQISSGKIWDNKKLSSLDSSSILFLIDFPSANSSNQLVEQVTSKIEKGTPFFISISSAADFGKLKLLEKYLPFYVKTFSQDLIQVQADIQKNEFVSSFSQVGNSTNVWNNLPPVFQSSAEIAAKPESKVIVKAKVRDTQLNSPLAVIRSIGNQRSFGLNAGNYWRWSLQSFERNPEFFRSFVNEIVKWLSLSGTKKQFDIRTNKKVYSANEQVELSAELYDNSFNPIDTAHISVTVSQANNNKEVLMMPRGNGIYTASFVPDSQGDFQVTAQAKTVSSSVIVNTRFSVTTSSLELLDTKMRVDYLKALANSANGKYFSIEEEEELLKLLEFENKKQDNGVIEKNDYELWNYSLVLMTIILLFAVEWFLRKRLGMI